VTFGSERGGIQRRGDPLGTLLDAVVDGGEVDPGPAAWYGAADTAAARQAGLDHRLIP
jgi:hypothetical protein